MYHNENFKTKRANSVDPDEVAHDEPPHLALHCLQTQLLSLLVLSVLTKINSTK